MSRQLVWLLLSAVCVFLLGCGRSVEVEPAPTEGEIAAPVFASTATPTPTAPGRGVTPEAITPQPGLLIKGYVRLADGSGVANVRIYRAFSAYPGNVVATTDAEGYYESGFQYIPGDEMVRVWAELEGYDFELEDEALSWEPGLYYWRHYYGPESATLNFVARPTP